MSRRRWRAGTLFALRAAEWQLPSGAADFIQTRRIADRMFNSYETGGYLVWRLWPMQRDFIDPRGLSEEAYADYKRILLNTDSARPLAEIRNRDARPGRLRLSVGPGYPLAAELAKPEQTEWKLVYADSQGVIFMRHPPPGVRAAECHGNAARRPGKQCDQHMLHDPVRPALRPWLERTVRPCRQRGSGQPVDGALPGTPDGPDPEAEQIQQSLRVTSLNDQALSLESKGDLTGAEPLFRAPWPSPRRPWGQTIRIRPVR